MIALFILIYLMSFALHLLLKYKENERYIRDIGDLIDNIEFYMWLPILNTLLLIAIVIIIVIIILWEVSKLNILWEKFRNIKLK